MMGAHRVFGVDFGPRLARRRRQVAKALDRISWWVDVIEDHRAERPVTRLQPRVCGETNRLQRRELRLVRAPTGDSLGSNSARVIVSSTDALLLVVWDR